MLPITSRRANHTETSHTLQSPALHLLCSWQTGSVCERDIHKCGTIDVTNFPMCTVSCSTVFDMIIEKNEDVPTKGCEAANIASQTLQVQESSWLSKCQKLGLMDELYRPFCQYHATERIYKTSCSMGSSQTPSTQNTSLVKWQTLLMCTKNPKLIWWAKTVWEISPYLHIQ